jgi:hypothetical protein
MMQQTMLRIAADHPKTLGRRGSLMPNCDYYALGGDFESILDFVFAQAGWELHELSSRPDQPVRVYSGTSQVRNDWVLGEAACHFQLYSPELGGEPIHRKITFKPGAVAGASYRFATEGWGLIQLYFGCLRPQVGLSHSHTNHFSQKGAVAWSEGNASLGPADDWDWVAIAKASGHLNRYIRRLGVCKLDSRPILPGAQEAVRAGAELLLNG